MPDQNPELTVEKPEPPAGSSVGQRLVNALESLVELQIYTCVGEGAFIVSKDPGSGLSVDPRNGQVPVSTTFYTEINLVSGDIISILPKDHQDPADPLHKIHEEKVKQGTEIVAANVATLKELLKDASEDLRRWLDGTSNRADKQHEAKS
ncbi:MAG: hypothetical protein U9Q81_16170 [Pseudomonadota bacterium]|nr:hypothetical protein [Pseudomonadota bacterium]